MLRTGGTPLRPSVLVSEAKHPGKVPYRPVGLGIDQRDDRHSKRGVELGQGIDARRKLGRPRSIVVDVNVVGDKTVLGQLGQQLLRLVGVETELSGDRRGAPALALSMEEQQDLDLGRRRETALDESPQRRRKFYPTQEPAPFRRPRRGDEGNRHRARLPTGADAIPGTMRIVRIRTIWPTVPPEWLALDSFADRKRIPLSTARTRPVRCPALPAGGG